MNKDQVSVFFSIHIQCLVLPVQHRLQLQTLYWHYFFFPDNKITTQNQSEFTTNTVPLINTSSVHHQPAILSYSGSQGYKTKIQVP